MIIINLAFLKLSNRPVEAIPTQRAVYIQEEESILAAHIPSYK